MATEKQIEANRRNALMSSGPKTEEGKAVSRLNAVTHGLTSSLMSAIPQSEAGLEERKNGWRDELRPEGDFQEAMFEQIVVESLRTDRCHQTFLALCAQHAERAKLEWDGDRRRDVAELAAGLSKNPRVVAESLSRSLHGCDLMIELWTGLRASLDRHKTWTDKQRSLALDLLGVYPELRDADTVLDPAVGDAYQARRTIVDDQLVRLMKIRERTVRLDASERAMAEKTLGAEFTKPVKLLDRYERNAFRRYLLAMKALKESQRGGPNETKPIPAPNRVETKPIPPTAEPKPARPIAVAPLRFEPESVATPPSTPRETNRTQFSTNQAGLNRHQRRKLAALERRAG